MGIDWLFGFVVGCVVGGVFMTAAFWVSRP